MIVTLLLGLALQNPQVTVVGDKPVKERKICKQVEGSTGSRLGGARECRTESEWKAMQTELSERDINTMMNTSGQHAGPDAPAGLRR